jgi:hypothetical protein
MSSNPLICLAKLLIHSFAWQSVDDLSWPRVVQFFARLVFNRIRITLQAVYMAFQPVIFQLQVLHLTIELVRLLPLLLIHSQSVRAENDMISDPESKRRSSHGRNFPSPDRDCLPNRTQRRKTAGISRNWRFHSHLFS